MKHNLCRTLLLFAGVFLFATIDAHFKTTPQSPVHITETDELVYKSYPNGDRIPDFLFVVIANLSIPFLGWMQKYMFLSWMEMQPVLFSRH